jgi:LysR family transcriptional regulator, transcriptional activator for bauABCD operon
MKWPHKLFLGQVSDFELRLLRIFRVVVECEGFTAAETELGITRSTISKHISDLETRLGARLCERGRSGFALTAEGRIVYEATAQLLMAVEEFRSRINQFHADLVGELHIGLIDTMVTMEEIGLHGALTRYTQQNPNVRLNIMVGTEGEIDRAVRERRLHVGVTVRRGKMPGVSVTPLATEANYLYCARGHEAFDLRDEEISLEDVSRYRMVRHGYSESESKAIRRWNLSAESTSHQTEGIMLLVLTGSFVGFLPDHFAERWEEEGRIRRILPDQLKNATEIIAITHKASQANPVVRQFLSFLSSRQEEPDRVSARPFNEDVSRSFGG